MNKMDIKGALQIFSFSNKTFADSVTMYVIHDIPKLTNL